MVGERQGLSLPEPEHRLALVIGVNQAPHAQTPQLQAELKAHSDAEAMAQVLQEQCGFELLQPPLLGEVATSEQVKRAVLALSRQRTGHDFLLLYFSGHGHPMTIPGNQQDIYLVTHDFNEQEVEEDEFMHCSMGWLRNKLYLPTGAGKVLVILDCCFAGNIGRAAPDPYLEDLKARIKTYFGAPGAESGSLPGGLRQALAATGHNQTAGEEGGHGRLTGHLLQALRGEVDDVIDLANHGYVTLYLLQNYLQRVMPETQRSSLSGDDAGKLCILAQYEQRAEAMRQQRRTAVHERPQSYIPFNRNHSFQQRQNDIKRVTELLTTQNTSRRAPIVGLTDLGGIGKTRLAVELAYRYKDEGQFPAGIFWLPVTGTSRTELCHQLANLAASAEYIPPGDDVSHPENDERRARRLCRYLAHHADALLILDNVEQIRPILDLLPSFAGEELRCAILYTSRSDEAPTYVRIYPVDVLSEDGALRLLLERRQELLKRTLAGAQDAESNAARALCRRVGYLPLALILLRDLLQDEHLTLVRLADEKQRRGTLAITSDGDIEKARLFQTFDLSWRKVNNPAARHLFLLASCFPAAALIPIWLLGLAADLPGENTSLDPLGRARMALQHLSLIEASSSEAVRLHPILREFGQYLLRTESPDENQALLTGAGARLLEEFTHISRLEQRALAKGYWGCLSDVQEVLNFARRLPLEHLDLLERVAYWLARDSSLLGTGELWPGQIPGLFYQQRANRATEEGYPLTDETAPTRWIKQLGQVGAEDRALLREFRHPRAVTSIDYSPDGRSVVTGCEDRIARMWDVASGQVLHQLKGHTSSITSVAFAHDGSMIVTGADDGTARVWDAMNGGCLHTLKSRVAWLESVVFSPDHKKVLATFANNTVQIWDIASEQVSAIFTIDKGRFVAASFFS